jgi:hypothetical protein
MRALYVDLTDSGTDWNRPLDVPGSDSKKLLNDAVNDYAGQRDRMTPERLRAMGEPEAGRSA